MTRPVLINFLAAALLLGAAAIFFAGQQSNPPGFYRDEASVAYNALTIAGHGVDEHGQRLPLFFRAFGEYKNPTFIYALAAAFRVAEPSNFVARRVAGVCVFLTAIVMAFLAFHMTGRAWIAAATFLATLFTPALFEISRLAFEVACFPLVLALFLLTAQLASIRERWSAGIVIALAVTLVLITVTYSIGRLLAPMLLVGLIFLLTADRRAGFLGLTLLYAIGGVLPLTIFQRTHDGALTGRFMNLTYASDSSPSAFFAQFGRHFIANLVPLGDPNPRHHVLGSGPSVLLMTIAFALIAAWFAVRESSRWLLFLCYGALVSGVPASLTMDEHHALRLIAYPVFLIALSIAAMQRLRARPLMAAILILGIVQAAYFFVQFHRYGGKRFDAFDAGSRRVVNHLLDLRERPIYLPEGPTYALAWWYAALRGVDRNAFVVLRGGRTAPPGSLLMTVDDCHRCALLIESGRYRGYRTTR